MSSTTFDLGVPDREVVALVSCDTETSRSGTSSLIVDLRTDFLLRLARATGSDLMAGAGIESMTETGAGLIAETGLLVAGPGIGAARRPHA